jgi:hypothetical protein
MDVPEFLPSFGLYPVWMTLAYANPACLSNSVGLGGCLTSSREFPIFQNSKAEKGLSEGSDRLSVRVHRRRLRQGR